MYVFENFLTNCITRKKLEIFKSLTFNDIKLKIIVGHPKVLLITKYAISKFRYRY